MLVLFLDMTNVVGFIFRYDLMCLCWFKHPVNRPDFSSVCENLECLLEREADYIQLDQFQEHIYTVLEPDTMEERVWFVLHEIKMHLFNNTFDTFLLTKKGNI